MSRPAKVRPDFRPESRAVLAALPKSVRDDLTCALDQARAAFWLQDQITCGELSFLDQAEYETPCWKSAEACEGMPTATLKMWLEDLAMVGLDNALAELAVLIAPADEATVARPTTERASA